MYKPKDLVCIHKETDRLEMCSYCSGITNFCGEYKNKLNIDPFNYINEGRVDWLGIEEEIG